MENFNIEDFISSHLFSDGYYHEDSFEVIFNNLNEFSSKHEEFADAVDDLTVHLLGKKVNWSVESTPNFTLPDSHIICTLMHEEKSYDLIFFTNTSQFVYFFVSTHATPSKSKDLVTFQTPIEIGKMVFKNAPFPYALVPSEPNSTLASLFSAVTKSQDRKPSLEILFTTIETMGKNLSEHHKNHVSQIDKATIVSHIVKQLREIELLFVKFAPKGVQKKFFSSFLPKLCARLSLIEDTTHAAVASIVNVNFHHISLLNQNLIVNRQATLALHNFQNGMFYTSNFWIETQIKAEIEKHALENGFNGEEIKLLLDSFEDEYRFILPDQLFDPSLEITFQAIALLMRWTTFFMIYEGDTDLTEVHTWYALKLDQLLSIEKF